MNLGILHQYPEGRIVNGQFRWMVAKRLQEAQSRSYLEKLTGLSTKKTSIGVLLAAWRSK